MGSSFRTAELSGVGHYYPMQKYKQSPVMGSPAGYVRRALEIESDFVIREDACKKRLKHWTTVFYSTGVKQHGLEGGMAGAALPPSAVSTGGHCVPLITVQEGNNME